MAQYSTTQIQTVAAMSGWPLRELTTAVAVARAESGGRTDAVNPSSGATGLWQIMPLPGRPSQGALKNPYTNGRAAYKIWKAAGGRWDRDWEAYTNGSYKRFLPSGSVGSGPADTTPISGQATLPTGGEGDYLGAGSAASLATQAGHALEWLARPSSWQRVGFVILGGALVLAGLIVVARPAVMSAARNVPTPVGTALKKVAA